ncbi:hypothetical protein KIH87_00480 [Paraneptunicella aestuarii]|uniref:putative metalloprotease CJM1_0395 family protein n=1 Tax=Paraneptunicella aestuarii TaxID=2831148 RepID=UPI001E2A6CDE|nr:putative metalloprotease CJM1_0395 family protein [Paraneptunicella aestuarii]UAA38889.1 hypothetical protein KIH87_00480 [Paraneptunicella aestuarii]
MNIVTPLPTAIPFTNNNVNTESARRENAQRETIPQTKEAENSAAESGLGSESDRVKPAGQKPQPVTYERPQPQTAENLQGQGENQDNAEDPSAGKESAQDKQQQQQAAADKKEIEDLKDRDREVRAHEQAHAAVGGQYAGAPSYEFKNGPDGRQYAVGGEVSIDISKESSPEKTLQKMQRVRAAALAPNEPSPQDFRVASEATQRAAEAQAEIARSNAEEAQKAVSKTFPDGVQGAEKEANVIGDVPELDDIVSKGDAGGVRRSLQQDDPVAEAAGLEMDSENFKQKLANRDEGINQRAMRIADFYQQVSQPQRYIVSQSA